MDKEQLTKLLTFGIQRGVSDIHFAVGHRPHLKQDFIFMIRLLLFSWS